MGDAYLVTYRRGTAVAYIGIGLRKGNVFCLSWISQGQAGITLYTIESGPSAGRPIHATRRPGHHQRRSVDVRETREE